MRVLAIDEEAKSKVKAVTDFAWRPENYYRVGKDGFTFQKPPGDDSRHVAQLNSYRCVFSITQQGKDTFKHLSISVPSENYPNPFAAFEIAQMFGFTRWDGHSMKALPEGWYGRISEEEHCIVLGQKIT